MRKLILFTIILFSNNLVRATECVDKTFENEKVRLYLCQNYNNYNETTSLLFKARAQVLNDYIKEKIKTGLLKNIKFDIQIYDAILTYPHLELKKTKKSYLINLSGFPTIEQLI